MTYDLFLWTCKVNLEVDLDSSSRSWKDSSSWFQPWVLVQSSRARSYTAVFPSYLFLTLL